MGTSARDRYIVKSIVHAAQVLRAFPSPREALQLRDVVQRTRLTKGMCFRILYTLHECGLIEKIGPNAYRSRLNSVAATKYRIGYAAQGQDTSFAKEVDRSLRQAADHNEALELLAVDNRYDSETALRNAEYLVSEHVDLVIEFQTDHAVAPVIASKYLRAHIPMIAVDIPHPGATYFGANNYEAGLIAGRHLAKWVKRHWGGDVEELILLEIRRAGQFVQMRLQGAASGFKETLRPLPEPQIVRLDGDGQFRTSFEVLRKHIRERLSGRAVIAAANDPSALGALRAFEEAGQADRCWVVGQNAEPDVREAMREPQTRLIGSVDYFPERYGPALLRLAIDILRGKSVPPAVFIQHRMITPENVDRYYPGDNLHV